MSNMNLKFRMSGLSARLALRDLKSGLYGFKIFVACIVLGVAAIIGVNSTARSLLDSLAREGQRVLGGDVSFTTILRELKPEERIWLEGRSKLSEIATMRAMSRNSDGQATLVEIKAVDFNYPPLGRIETDPASSPIQEQLQFTAGSFGLYGEESLQIRLNLKPGDAIFVGDARFAWRGIIRSEPDKLGGGMNLGPRVIMSIDALRASGLIQPGSLVRWSYRAILSSDTFSGSSRAASISSIARFVSDVEKTFPEAGWRVATRDRISPNFSRNLNRFTQFLNLVGLTALIIGGLGIANAVGGFVKRKELDFATLKALGAPGYYVFSIALSEILMVAAIGVSVGVLIGAALPYLVAAVFGKVLPLPFSPAIYVSEIVLGVVYGFLAALIFALTPLGKIHDAPVSVLFRQNLAVNPTRLRWPYRLLICLFVTVLIMMIIATASEPRSASIYLISAGAVLALLQLVGLAATVIARSLSRRGPFAWRLAVANLGRPGALTRPVIASMGLGMSLFVSLTIIDVNIREPLQQGIPGKTPSFFFMDIQASQESRFSTFLKDNSPEAVVDMVPMLRGRLVQVNGKDARTLRAKENVTWVLEGDRGITFSGEMPANSKIVRGEWWPKDYKGEPVVSVEAEVADGLGIGPGDQVTLNILGRNITARVANTREVNWRTYGINFVFVFDPSTFTGAPYSWLATATFNDSRTPAQEVALVSDITRNFPTISTIRLKETLQSIAEIARQLGYAIRGATLLALVASALVLAGTLAASQSARTYDAVVLKILGATRRRLLATLCIEFLILGLAITALALLLGATTARLVAATVLQLESFTLDWWSVTQTTLLVLVIITVIGLAGTWRVLGQSPARKLRNT